MPASFSCSEVYVKRDCQEGILDDWEERFRPMSLRKVSTSGTKGVGCGTGRVFFAVLEACLCWVMDWWWRHGAQM